MTLSDITYEFEASPDTVAQHHEPVKRTRKMTGHSETGDTSRQKVVELRRKVVLSGLWLEPSEDGS